MITTTKRLTLAAQYNIHAPQQCNAAVVLGLPTSSLIMDSQVQAAITNAIQAGKLPAPTDDNSYVRSPTTQTFCINVGPCSNSAAARAFPARNDDQRWHRSAIMHPILRLP